MQIHSNSWAHLALRAGGVLSEDGERERESTGGGIFPPLCLSALLKRALARSPHRLIEMSSIYYLILFPAFLFYPMNGYKDLSVLA